MFKHPIAYCITLMATLFALPALAQEVEAVQEDIAEKLAIVAGFETVFSKVVDGLATVLFYEVLGFPFVVLWLVMGGVFFTLRLGFVNLRMFGHGVKVAFGKFSKDDDPGEVTPFASLSAAVSGTVGLGNIAGVAVAVTAGGPGAVIWMMVCGFLGMSTKFAEVTLGHKYRKFDENGKVSGGAFYYLRDGLADLGKAGLGKVLAVIFAILCLGGAFGGGNMFQANQMVAAMTTNFEIFSGLDWVLAAVMAVAVGIVLIGGVKRIAQVAEAIVPSMAIVYLLGGFSVLFMNLEAVPGAIATM
ncbi:MAG: alanine:cation symporter family protein, partial [Rickettsiales bacterium]